MKKKSRTWWKKAAAVLVLTVVCMLGAKGGSVEAATVKYASELKRNGANVTYQIGSHRYYAKYSERGKSALYEMKNGKRTRIAQASRYFQFQAMAEYGNYLYYTLNDGSGGCDLYRYNRKTKKKALVRRSVRTMLIVKGKLITNGFATDVSAVPIYVSRLDGKKAKRIAKNSDQAKMKVYGNRIYYIERTFNSKHTKSTQRLVSRTLTGGKRKVYGKAIKSPASICYFNNQYLIYSTGTYSSGTKYYQLNLKNNKKKRIYPSSDTINEWYDQYYY